MDIWVILHQVGLHVLDVFKIYLKFAFLTLIVYLVAEWYIIRYGAELEAQLDAHLVEGAAEQQPEDTAERAASNSTLGKVFRFVVNFFIL